MAKTGFLFENVGEEGRQIIKKDAQDIWISKVDFHNTYLDPDYGIGLVIPAGGTFFDKYKNGDITTGIIDCGPNVNEYGRLTYEEDIYYGVSDIVWYIRSSSDMKKWSHWYQGSTAEVPVQQFVQFKFELSID